MRIFKRIIRLLTGSIEETVRQVERRNPETILENAIAAKRKNLADLMDATARMAHYRNSLRQTFAGRLQKLQTLEMKIRQAVKDKDEAAGPGLLMQRTRLASRIEEERESIKKTDSQLEAMKQQTIIYKDQLEAFQTDRNRILAEIKWNEAKRKALEAGNPYAPEFNDRALQDLLENASVERCKTELAEELTGDASQASFQDDLQLYQAEFETLCHISNDRIAA